MIIASRDWLTTFSKIGMVWWHDGNPKRPYAKLTSGRISDGFVNCTKLTAKPKLLNETVRDLVGKYCLPNGPDHVVVGQAMGSITMASHLAAAIDAECCWSEKMNDECMVIDPRFTIEHGKKAIIVEDVGTTWSTTRKTIAACKRVGIEVAPFLYVLVNRSGTNEVDGLEVRALVTLTIQSWKWGHNPFTEDGMERVEAVRPKDNWDALTRKYT